MSALSVKHIVNIRVSAALKQSIHSRFSFSSVDLLRGFNESFGLFAVLSPQLDLPLEAVIYQKQDLPKPLPQVLSGSLFVSAQQQLIVSA